jgi:hypothetical protein
MPLFTEHGNYGRCRQCLGSTLDISGHGVCHWCRGTGCELTDIGKELIDFLNEHFVLTPKPEAR